MPAQHVVEAGSERHHLVAGAQRVLPSPGQADAVSRARDEAHPQPQLEADLQALERVGGHAELVGGAREAALAGGHPEGVKLRVDERGHDGGRSGG